MKTITGPELKLLLLVASPLTAWRSEGDPTAQRLVRTGLMAEANPGIARITPLGLRVLAGAIEQGHHKSVIEAMISEVNNRQRKVSAMTEGRPISPPSAP